MKSKIIRIIPDQEKTFPRSRNESSPSSSSTFLRPAKTVPFLLFVFFLVFTLSFLIVKNLKSSNAYSISNFRAGNIISDYTMTNTGTMNQQQIQEFLTQKNPCNDYNISRASQYPGYHYHIENGKFVCLSEETFEYNGVKQTAAQVIYEASQDYRINPQVLIVLLEKEQGLITDTWPNHIQYRSATGFGCPDTAACDSKYYGFRNQVRNAARLFREVLDGGYTNYPVGENFVHYNPNFACGGSKVYIENLATSSLYRYTPYQPNAEAIKNYPGTAYCGAYGNRNFYAFFIRWFGDPTITKHVVKYKTIDLPDQNANKQGIIPNGKYFISTALDKKFYLDVQYASKDENAKIQLYSRWTDHNPAQQWQFTNLGNDIYTIKSLLSGKNLSYDFNGILNNPQIKLSTENINDCSQRWQAVKNQDQYMFYSSCDANRAIDVRGALAHYSNPVQIYPKWSDTNKAQIWSLEKITAVTASAPKPLIEDGAYYIKTSLNPYFYLDVAYASSAEYAKVQLYSQWSKTNQAQIWQLKHLGNNQYQIRSTLSGKLLSFDPSHAVNNQPIYLTTARANNCSQIWQAEQTNEGFFFRTTCDEKKALDVTGAIATYGTQIQIWDKWSDTNKAQIWSLEKITAVTASAPKPLIEDGAYYIKTSLNPYFYLDVAYASSAEYAKVQLYSQWSKTNQAQIWQLKHLGNNQYQIRSTLSGKLLSFDPSHAVNNQPIYLTTARANNCSQIWQAEQTNEGFFFRTTCDEKKALDVTGAIATYGTQIQIWDKWSDTNKAQIWSLEKANF